MSLKYFSNADRDKCEEAEPAANLNSTDESLVFPKQANAAEQQKFTCMHTDLNKFQLSLLSGSDQYVPTTLSVYKCDIKINFVDYGLSLTDTSGCRHNKKFVQLRQYYYTITKVCNYNVLPVTLNLLITQQNLKDIDVILMCFSLVDPTSFSNITKKVKHLF